MKYTPMLAVLTLGASFVAHAESQPTRNLSENDVREIIQEYLVNENPEILISMSNKLRAKQLTKQANEDSANIKQYAKELAHTSTSPHIGNPKGALNIIEFFDYNCGYCKQSASFTFDALKEYTNVNYVFKELPILHPLSTYASKAALAVHHIAPKKYLNFHKELMAHKGAFKEEKDIQEIAKKVGLNWTSIEKMMESDVVQKELDNNQKLAQALNISGTPAFIIGDQVLRGSPGSAAELNKLIAQALKK